MMHRFFFISLFTLLFLTHKAHSTPIFDTIPRVRTEKIKVNDKKQYPFILIDGTALRMPMRATTTVYPSLFRYLYRAANENENKKKAKLLNLATLLAHTLTIPWTHEEGHRSILTNEEIGSISAPIFDKNGVAKVIGVTDSTLSQLRNNKLPTYIRLHTAGLESDLLIKKDMESLLLFREDDVANVRNEFALRTFAITSYYFLSLFKALEPSIKEDKNQLKNDIVGHDVYGAIRNLYRPQDSFYRYTRFDDLKADEKKYLKRVSLLALTNLISPVYIKFLNGKFANGARVAFGLSYNMVPFGDMVELNIWYHNRKQKYLFGLRSYNNIIEPNDIKTGGGISFLTKDVSLNRNWTIDMGGEVFRQPKNFDFKTNEFFNGFALESYFKYRFPKTYNFPFECHIGLKWKTEGFIQGDASLNQGFLLRIGGALIL